jgi:hypothetical protein
MANEQKERAAEGIGGAAEAARHVGDELRGQSETLASWVHIASDQLQMMANRLRDRQPAELVEDLSRFARQRPGIFIGGAFLLGVALARLPKNAPSSSRRYSGMPSTSSTPRHSSPLPQARAGDMRTGDGGTAWSPTTGG